MADFYNSQNWFYGVTTHQKLRKTGRNSHMEFRIELGISSLLRAFTVLCNATVGYFKLRGTGNTTEIQTARIKFVEF